MSKSTSPDNNPTALEIIRGFTAEFDFDDDGNIIEEPYLLPAAKTSPVPRSSAGTSTGDTRPFTAEIEALRIALLRLEHILKCVDTIEEQLQVLSAINLATASIGRLVRAQINLHVHRPVEFNRETKAALEVVRKEWGLSA